MRENKKKITWVKTNQKSGKRNIYDKTKMRKANLILTQREKYLTPIEERFHYNNNDHVVNRIASYLH